MKHLLFVVALIFILSIPCLGAKKEGPYLNGIPGTDYAIDLAHPEKGKVKLPVGAANIRAVVEVDKYIVGVTKPEHVKRSPLIFRFDIQAGKIVDFIEFATLGENGRLPSMSLVCGKDNRIYMGTYGDSLSTGKLFRIDVSGSKIKVESLGPVAEKNGIFTLALSLSGDKLFGILTPYNGFFTYDLVSGKATQFKELELDSVSRKSAQGIYAKGEPAGVLNGKEAALCRALAVDKSGRVFGSTDDGRLFYFDSKENKIVKTKTLFPYVQERSATNHVACWAQASNGKWYGGTTEDGFLFSLDPVTLAIGNLGKPVTAGCLKSMFIRNGLLHGLVGEGLDYTHYFVYDLAKASFEDKGFFRFTNTLINGRHRTYTAAQLVPLKDGRILVAEDDLLPTFLFYTP